MKKYDRQRIIFKLIQDNVIETQDQLTELLRRQGVNATQATISRDIKELRIDKVQTYDGRYNYTVIEATFDSLNERLSKIFKSAVISVKSNRGQIVINTVSYAAAVAALFLTNQKISEIAGMIAGHDTILVQINESADINEVIAKIEGFSS